MPASAERLRYPLPACPEIGEILDVAPGLGWLRLPLPFLLQHINVWLLRDGDGWALVDTGLYTGTTRAVWDEVFEQRLDGPLTQLVVTHLHPDHAGCAGWLAERFGIGLSMPPGEYELCRVLIADTGKPAPVEALAFYAAAGVEGSALDRYAEHFGLFGRVVAPLPDTNNPLQDGQLLRLGEDHWEIIEGRGHSPQHACLWCRERGLLIAGDQVLPTISPNVSVYPRDPLADPLNQWFESLERLRARVDADALVLPAHGKPFTGLGARLDALRDEHELGLQRLRRLCREPRRAVDTFPALFKSRITDNNLVMAIGEAVAHLNFLLHRGELQTWRDDLGVNWYRLSQ